LDNDLEQLDNK